MAFSVSTSIHKFPELNESEVDLFWTLEREIVGTGSPSVIAACTQYEGHCCVASQSLHPGPDTPHVKLPLKLRVNELTDSQILTRFLFDL